MRVAYQFISRPALILEQVSLEHLDNQQQQYANLYQVIRLATKVKQAADNNHADSHLLDDVIRVYPDGTYEEETVKKGSK